MKEMELEEIAGIWRNDEGSLTIDLTVRVGASSRYTETKKKDHKVERNEEGNASIEQEEDLLKLTINDTFSVAIWRLGPKEDELTIVIDGKHLKMKRIL